MKKLTISNTLSLPLDFLTSTQGILAKKRRGKSYLAQVEAEELLKAGQQVVVLDPTSAWFGLRSSADGKSAGYSITIFGGDHADAPLEPAAGEMIATAIVQEGFSAILDLSALRKGERLRFAADFIETLYRLNRAAMHLFIDEADVFAPQVPRDPQQARLLGATDELVRRGGIKGIGVTLISQRPQVVNKDVLSQIDMLMVLQMNHPKDLRAIEDWVSDHVNKHAAIDMIASLPSLPIGTAWCWAPEAKIFEKVQIRKKRTFDSGRTPKAGERPAPPKVLAKIDVERLGAAIKETVERAKENDPTALRATLAKLRRENADLRATNDGITVDYERKLEKLREKTSPVGLTEKQMSRLEAIFERADRAQQPLTEELRIIRGLLIKAGVHAPAAAPPPPSRGGYTAKQIEKLATTLPNPQESAAQYHARAGIGTPPAPRDASRAAASDTSRRTSKGSGDLPPGEAKILAAVIQFPAGLTREQLTVLVGYRRRSRNSYLTRLTGRGLVETAGDRVVATAAGRAAMPNAEPLPTGVELREYWMEELPPGEATILEQLCAAYPSAVDRETITGYARSSRNSYITRLAAKELVEQRGRGMVAASPTLFEVA